MKEEKEPLDTDIVKVNAIMRRDRREELKRKAEAANLTISEFVGALIVSSKVVAKPDKREELKKLNSWLGRINSNLNMISKHANIFKAESDGALMNMRLVQIRQDVQKLVKEVTK
ncbi:hypothetical protein D3C85_609900 [compost metagenome]